MKEEITTENSVGSIWTLTNQLRWTLKKVHWKFTPETRYVLEQKSISDTGKEKWSEVPH